MDVLLAAGRAPDGPGDSGAAPAARPEQPRPSLSRHRPRGVWSKLICAGGIGAGPRTPGTGDCPLRLSAGSYPGPPDWDRLRDVLPDLGSYGFVPSGLSGPGPAASARGHQAGPGGGSSL